MARKRIFKRRITLSFTLEKDEYIALAEISAKKRISLSSLIRSLVKQYLNGYTDNYVKELMEASQKDDGEELPPSGERVPITFLKDYQGFRIGSSIFVTRAEAEKLIQARIAKLGEGIA
jgi:hypothetical protein